MTQLQNQRNVTLSHVCVSMQSVRYCNSHLSHMDIFSGSNLVQQRAQTSPSSPTTSSSSLSSCVGAVHTCAGTCSHAPYGGYRTCLLLPLGQRLSTDKWPCHMEAPLVCTIHGANLIINIMPLAPFRPFAIPNENIRRCPRGQRTNPNDVAQAVNGNRNFVYAPGVFRIKQDITNLR